MNSQKLVHELNNLMGITGDPAVSIYMHTETAVELHQNPIRLKNMIKETETKLEAYNLNPLSVKELVGPLYKLLEDENFWQHQSGGLAIFLAPTHFQYFRLPVKFEELVTISSRFHIKPLVSLLQEDGVFYLLALSLHKVRLFECSHYSVRDITPKDIPSSLEEALKFDQQEKQHQFHSTGPGGQLVQHGQGVARDYEKSRIARFFKQLDNHFHVIFKDHTPLVLAAVDYLHPVYREVNSYRYLIEEGLNGNFDDENAENLKSKAWEIVQPLFKKQLSELLDHYGKAVANNQGSNDIRDIVKAAYDGRVATVFLSEGMHEWGYFNEEQRKVHIKDTNEPGSEDLLDLAAFLTLRNNGEVYTLNANEIPGAKNIAAIFRY